MYIRVSPEAHLSTLYPGRSVAGLCDVRLVQGWADQSGLEGVALHCPGGYIRRVLRALGQTAKQHPIMEGGEGPAPPTASQTTSGKDQSAVANGRGKSSKGQKVQKTYKRSRRSPHRRRRHHRRYRRTQKKISALKASQTRVRRRARIPVRRYCLINLVRTINDPETQDNCATTNAQDPTTNDQQAHPGAPASQDLAPSREPSH
ncbi:hypothetical protein APTSU1_001853900 [Apodemus speciosus]|uniref:Uncharacterized protein n=1 Tax=Apodemus speciosus TaxID=105296 RepID=A0ABQ0FVN0_APOSI